MALLCLNNYRVSAMFLRAGGPRLWVAGARAPGWTRRPARKAGRGAERWRGPTPSAARCRHAPRPGGFPRCVPTPRLAGFSVCGVMVFHLLLRCQRPRGRVASRLRAERKEGGEAESAGNRNTTRTSDNVIAW